MSMSEEQRAGLMSSNSHEWYTPRKFFEPLHAEFNFTLDVCATPESAVVPNFFSKEQDGLIQKWDGVCWMNPPYGRGIGAWVKKAYESSLGGATVVCLLPSRTDTRWFHDYCLRGEYRFVKGRIQFINGKELDNAPFPSVVVIFRPNNNV